MYKSFFGIDFQLIWVVKGIACLILWLKIANYTV